MNSSLVSLTAVFLGCHATLPLFWEERCVTSQKKWLQRRPTPVLTIEKIRCVFKVLWRNVEDALVVPGVFLVTSVLSTVLFYHGCT